MSDRQLNTDEDTSFDPDASDQPNGDEVEVNKYTLAGWLAIASAILIFPEAIMGMLLDIKPDKLAMLAFPWTIITALEVSFSVYVMLRFKHLLNEWFNFHRVDTLILLLILGSIIMSSFGVSVRLLKILNILPHDNLKLGLLFITTIVILGIPMAVIGVVFGLRLLKLEDDLGGYRKPLAYVTIIASICFATMILAIVGMLLSAAFNFMLGMLFLKAGEMEATPEFV